MTTENKSLNQILKSLKTSKIRYKAEPILSFSEFSSLEAKFTPQILVTGTNGKGSVCSILASILQAQGYKTGLFLTPHLVHPRERMLINGQEIRDYRMKQIFSGLQKTVLEFTNSTGWELTFFEWMLVIAIHWFYEEKCDVCVFEAGLGGLRDASRCLNPLVGAITNVSADHLHILGPTLNDVAREKAAVFFRSDYGILGLPLELSEKVQSMPQNKNCRFFTVGSFVKIKSMDISGMSLSLDWKNGSYDVVSRLTGSHQVDNLNCALSILSPIERRFPIDPESIQAGLKNVYHKCRMEILNQEPLVIVDGCHNAEGLKFLKMNLNSIFKDRPIVYCLAMKNSKFHEHLQDILSGCEVWLVPHREKGFMQSKELKACFPEGHLLRGRREVWQKFIGLNMDNKVLVYCGSLRFAGLVRNDFRKKIHTKSYKKD